MGQLGLMGTAGGLLGRWQRAHLRVMREAGLVSVRGDAQRRLYRIRAEPLAELDAWLAPYRKFWADSLDRLEAHLDSSRRRQ